MVPEANNSEHRYANGALVRCSRRTMIQKEARKDLLMGISSRRQTQSVRRHGPGLHLPQQSSRAMKTIMHRPCSRPSQRAPPVLESDNADPFQPQRPCAKSS